MRHICIYVCTRHIYLSMYSIYLIMSYYMYTSEIKPHLKIQWTQPLKNLLMNFVCLTNQLQSMFFLNPTLSSPDSYLKFKILSHCLGPCSTAWCFATMPTHPILQKQPTISVWPSNRGIKLASKKVMFNLPPGSKFQIPEFKYSSIDQIFVVIPWHEEIMKTQINVLPGKKTSEDIIPSLVFGGTRFVFPSFFPF